MEMPVINANSVNPDQTPRFAASDLVLHCLLMSHLWDARHKWVKRADIFATLSAFLKQRRHILPIWFPINQDLLKKEGL